MGKKSKRKLASKGFEHPHPSRYGSHAEMISETERPLDNAVVICVDERGPYVTDKNRLDTGIADPRRWAESRFRDTAYIETETVIIK